MSVNFSPMNRILVVDDDALIIEEYLHCLGEGFEPDPAVATLTELEKVLFGVEAGDDSPVRFTVQPCSQGEQAVQAVRDAVRDQRPYAIAFIDIRMKPGIDGLEAARQIRQIDANVNIVIVTGSLGRDPGNLGATVPPADRIFFFRKPFHAVECRQLAAALCGKWHADRALRRANEVLEQRVTERTAALHELAYFDPVTRLPNKLKLLDDLRALIDRSQSREDATTAAVVLDVERFRFLNETMGYEAGTELLAAIGGRLTQSLDGHPAGSAVVGRYGADEFACLFADLDEADLAQRVAAVKQAIETPFTVAGREVFLKAAIGVAWHPRHGDDAQAVLQCAEAALHRSMRKPDCEVTYYNRGMHFKARHKFDMEAELRTAIQRGEITAYFQPQRCLRTGAIAGIEALARWRRPDGSEVPPREFVPLSEEVGISDMLFEAVLGYVCDAVDGWRRDRPWIVPVSVNLSAHQLRNLDLVGLIDSILKRRSLDQRLINLELTESVLLEDLTLARPVLRALSLYGVGIQIDDFGTGYSSLSYLAELPVKTLKIDASFVERMTENPTNARVVQAIIALGKALTVEVIAEGIETEQQLTLLREYGCDLAQGFHVGRPLPRDEFLAWVDSGHRLEVRDSETTVLADPGTPAA